MTGTEVGNQKRSKFSNGDLGDDSELHSSQDDSQDDEELIPRETLDYTMAKPGPHAKASEWRKWKTMKRAIREQREVRRLVKRQKIEKEKIEEKAEIEQSAENQENNKTFTISVAIPGSAIEKVQSKELKTYVSGQIARAATLFCIDEIIIYNEYPTETKIQSENNQQLIKILEYLECPQYLRKALFPPHKYLEHVGLLHPLEAPHHFKLNDSWRFREGVVTDIPTKDNAGSYVDIGLMNKIQVDKKIQSGIRVTVKKTETESGKLKGIIVSPSAPKKESGIYWGYQVRYADAFKKVLSESVFKENYDLKIAINSNKLNFKNLGTLPKANHILIVFGGIHGVEAAIEADEKLKAGKVEQIFQHVCEIEDTKTEYGSRSIRIEEAILMSLAVIKPLILESWNN